MTAQPIPPPPPRSGPVLTPAGQFQLTTWSGWFRTVFNIFNSNASQLATAQKQLTGLSGGITVVITTAALTPSTGSNGSMTFTNGVLTHQVQAT